MAGNAISYEDYKKLLATGQKYVTQQQAVDPEWAAWLQDQQQNYMSLDTFGQGPPSPDKDYWAQYMTTLTPQQQLGFQQNMADSKSWTDQVGSVLKYAIPAVVGGAGLAATGLLGAPLQAAVGGAPLGGAAAAAGAAGAGEAAATLPMWDTGVGGLFGSQAALDGATASAGWFPGASMAGGTGTAGSLILGDLMPAGYQSVLGGSSLMDKLISKAPDLLKQAGGLMGGGAAGQGGEGGGMPTAFGYRPYTPPAAPAPAPFKAPTGLADFARGLQIARKPRGLMGF